MKKVIAALCTPMIKSALAVIRVCGEGTRDITEKIFGYLEPRKVYYKVIDTKKIKDGVVVVFYKSPNSFTGEDTLEITCHGNPVIANEILNFLYSLGAVPAQRGEFSKIAYLNGKTDLTVSEGINDIINADTTLGVKIAFDATNGKLFRKINELQERLRDLNAKTEVAIDYPEEELEEFTQNQILVELNNLILETERLIKSYEGGKVIKEGIKVAIIGKPNTGKSSLLNRLVGDDLAIVTDIEGTTRDVIRGSYVYKDICFLLADTAGIRKTDDTVEKIGVQRSFFEAKESDVVLHLIENDEKEDFEFSNKVVRIKNKSDICTLKSATINVSAKTGENIEKLKELLFNLCVKGIDEEFMLTNRRQFEQMKECNERLVSAKNNLNLVTLDCISADLMDAYDALGKITGLIGSEQVIDSIFKNFCVGK